ncbi:MAG: efflux transporter outer membrane subunit [Planctomycetes bacterium]|nr:efflux transporter outer membrane subunit [Planctomycetota bacterium]
MLRSRRYVPWLLSGVLTACVSIREPSPDLARAQLDLPERFAAADAAGPAHEPVQNDWVATFADPMLGRLVDEAIAHNPDLRQAAAAQAEARARVQSASSSLWPQIDATDTTRRARPLFLIPGRFAAASQYYVNVQASWELDLWGRVRSAAAAAEASAEAQRLDLAAARQSLAAAVADAWFLALQAQATLAIDRELFEAESRTADVTADKVAAGAGTQLEAELAGANVSLAQAALTADEAAIQDLTRALEVLLGRYPAAELALAAELPAFPGAVGAGVPAELLERRPDLVAADRRVAAAFHLAESARAARLPRITLNGSLGSVLQPVKTIWSFGAGITAPLWTGGRLDADVEIADQQQQQAMAAWQATALDAFREVESALANEGWLAARERELDVAVGRLRNASRVGEDRYNASILSIVDLVTIRRQDFQSRRELLQVETQRLRQRVALHLALGGSFDAAAALDEHGADVAAASTSSSTERSTDD